MHPEDDERHERAHARHQNPVLPVVWCSTDGGINYDCPKCRGPLHEEDHGRSVRTPSA